MKPLIGKKGISGSTVKMIAMITMFIDHIGAVLVERAMLLTEGEGIFIYNPKLTIADMILRWIGRLAFPIFCFLLVEGFLHTKNVWKYALRLGIFAVVSEVPFDLAFKDRVFDMGYQNVFFTLLIGLMVLIAVDRVWKEQILVKMFRLCLCGSFIIVGMLLAQALHTDYGAFGVGSIVMLYLLRHNRMGQILAGCVLFAGEITAPLAFLPIAAYNGERGFGRKYVFYVFYPLHLLVLYFVAMLLGLT